MNFASFSNALVQLSQGIEAGSQGERSHVAELADLQAELDRLKLEAKAKADALRAKGAAPVDG